MTKDRLKELIEASGLTVREAAEKLGTSDVQVHHLMAGRRVMRSDFSEKAETLLTKIAQERVNRSIKILGLDTTDRNELARA